MVKLRALIVSIILLSLTSQAAPSVLLAALVKVGDKLLTTRDIQVAGLLNEIQENPILKLGKKTDPIQVIVLEHLVFLEARPFQRQWDLTKEREQLLKKIQRKFLRDSLWKKLSVPQSELRGILDKRLLVRDFLAFKFDGSLIAVSKAEVESFYRFNREKYGSQSFEKMETKLTKTVRKTKRQKRIYDWFSALQKRHTPYYYSDVKL